MSAKKAGFIASVDTDVPVSRSVNQIRELVERFGASEFSIQYDPATGVAVGIGFKIRDPHLGVFLPVALRAPNDTVYQSIIKGRRGAWQRDVQERCRAQADRVAWRNLHDFVRASLIGVQTGIMTLGEAFMASLVVTLPTGEAKRLGEIAAEGALLRPESGRLLLGSGGAR